MFTSSRLLIEVLGNHVISFAELDRLHYLEGMLERYYNSHHFPRTINYLTRRVYDGQAFKFFEDLGLGMALERPVLSAPA